VIYVVSTDIIILKPKKQNGKGNMMMDLTNNEYIGKCLKASANNRYVLILTKLDHLVKRFDGRQVSYRIEARLLSVDPTFEGDEVCCVRWNEFSYWSRAELQEIGALKKHSSLNDCLVIL